MGKRVYFSEIASGGLMAALFTEEVIVLIENWDVLNQKEYES